MAQGRPLNAKLFLEGIEVPFIGASITCTVNQASIAYIDLIPHVEINNIKPRTQVQLHVRDFNDEKGNFPYVLAWEGEVFGFTQGKTAASRMFTISCIDYTSYWDNVLTYFFNTEQSLGKGMKNFAKVGQDALSTTKLGISLHAVVHSSGSFFKQLLSNVLNDSSKDFLDAFIEVLKNVNEVNEFYNLATDRLRINDRIALHSSQALNELLNQAESLQWFTAVIGRNTGYTTLRTVVQDLLGLIFHDFSPIPFPGRVANADITNPLISQSNEKQTIGNFVFKPNLYMIPPPSCNIFFPDEYSNFQYSRNFFQEPTRIMYRPEIPRAFSGGSQVLPLTFQPDSLAHFMSGKSNPDQFVGVGDFEIPESRGFFNDDDPNNVTNQGKKREAQFLTNEELLKGIIMSIESMVPATTDFRQAISDLGKESFTTRVARYLLFKKRFEPRGLQITAHLKLSVVPGFTVLLLDDSEAEQNIVAYCSSVTHRIYATEGGYTNVQLSYARNVTEQDQSSNKAGEPLVPPWMSEAIFGTITTPPASEADPSGVANAGVQLVSTSALSDFYKTLLGKKGSLAVTNRFSSEPTIRGATAAILKEYRGRRDSGEDLQTYIAAVTGRDYVKMKDAFGFLGATTKVTDLENTPFLEFKGDRLQGVNFDDEEQIALRRAVVERYRTVLKSQRGFRG